MESNNILTFIHLEKEERQRIHGKKITCLEPQPKGHTIQLGLESLDSEVSEMKLSVLKLHQKVNSITFMLDSFMKDMKGMVVEDVEVEKE